MNYYNTVIELTLPFGATVASDVLDECLARSNK